MSEVINIKELNERIERESVFVDTLRAEMSKVIVGQTHLIDTLLIGLLSKTAILITEYAADRRAAGMSLTQAAVSAAKARLRPILMTVLTCVFGMIPLVFSHGVGANGNSTLGSGVVGGMIVGTLALLFLVPTLFIVFQTLQEKVKPLEFDPDPQWAVRAELEECKNEKE